ncbi:hypothetical protein HKD37_17G049216 [Glycine soja]
MVENRLRWFGHVERRPVDSAVRRVDQMERRQTIRGRGRPKKTIREVIKKDLEINGLDRRRGWIVSLSLSMDLQDFLIRARVLRLYRQALRIAGRAPSSAKAELRQTIRQEMENNRNCNDKQRIRFLISEGLDKLKRLDEMLDMQGYR